MAGSISATTLAAAGLAVTAAGTAYSILSRPSAPSAPGPQSIGTPPAVPSLQDPSVMAAADAQATAAANAKGRASTILTSGQGDTSPLTTQKKQLLGG